LSFFYHDLESLTRFQKLLWVGGNEGEEPKKETILETRHWQMDFFRNEFATFILKTPVKIAVLIAFVFYLYISITGMLNVDTSYLPRKFYRYDSWMYEFEYLHDHYMTGGTGVYGERYQILITTPLDYSNTTVQENVLSLLDRYSQIKPVTPEFSENWLRDFLRWAKLYQEFEDIDISTEQGFINTLRNKYLSENSPLSTDVVFNENKTEIIATRYILQLKNLDQKFDDLSQLMKKFIDISETVEGFNVSTYLFWNRVLAPTLIIHQQSLKLIVMASAIVLFISGIFIPCVAVIFCVFFTIVSTEIGVVGFMTLWDVSLDPSSLACLIMCIGFSVDFSAHMSYAFVSAKEKTWEDKLRSALHAVGLPIFQGAISTLITISPLLIVPSYTYIMFAKIFFLVIIFAFFHAVFVLPVLISLFNMKMLSFSRSKGGYDVNE